MTGIWDFEYLERVYLLGDPLHKPFEEMNVNANRDQEISFFVSGTVLSHTVKASSPYLTEKR